MITCSTGKKAYTSQQIAEDALLETWSRYNVSLGSGPVTVYRCEDCAMYHLTSKGEMNPRLAKHIAEGKIRRQQEINFWENKFKK
jgi:hypothetical protein